MNLNVQQNQTEQITFYCVKVNIAAEWPSKYLRIKDHPFKTSTFLGGRDQKLARFADG